MKIIRNICVLLFIPGFLHAQYVNDSYKFCTPISVSGAIKAGGYYRYLKGVTNDIFDEHKGTQLYGGLLLNLSTAFLHPNFMLVDAGIEYMPGKGDDIYLVSPDMSETRTLKRFQLNTTFFNQKPFTIRAFGNYNEMFQNRENLSDLKSTGYTWGGGFTYSNKFLPVNANYQQGQTKQVELQTGRYYQTDFKYLEARVEKSFSIYNHNELGYNHNDYFRQDMDYTTTRNIIDNLFLSSDFSFDRRRNYTLYSNISGTNQAGYEVYRKFQVMENLSLLFPKNLTFYGNYNYNYTNYKVQWFNQNSLNATLKHKLYQSLTTSVGADYYRVVNTYYSENMIKAGFDILYEKKIPGGRLTLGYKFFWQRQDRNAMSQSIRILNEDHILEDGTIVLLNKPYVDEGTVVVKDKTGTVIYQMNFDYVLIRRDNFIEIQRIPGGQIANKSAVSVDYTSTQPGSYQYDVNYHQITASILLFRNILEVYYRLNLQNYSNLHVTEYLILNYLTQNVIGMRVNYKFLNAGAEYEIYNSTILPYRMARGYMTLQGSSTRGFHYSLNGNVSQYRMTDDNTTQEFADVSAKVGIPIVPQISLNLEVGYRKQVGQGIDLNLIIARGELRMMFRKLAFNVGVETYRRDYLHELTNYIGGYFELARLFNWNRKCKN